MAGSTVALASQRTKGLSDDPMKGHSPWPEVRPSRGTLVSLLSPQNALELSGTIWNYRPRTSQSKTVGPIARVRVTAKLRFCCWNISYSLIGHYIIYYLVGGWPTPLKKKVRQLGWLFRIHVKIKHVLNHQTDYMYVYIILYIYRWL
jgi:hypothetical protein